jgi:hypothetical protein
MDLTLSGSKIGTSLGISQVSVVRHAIRLNLPMNTPDSRIVQGYARHRNPNKSFSEMRTQYRQEWLKIVEENPEASRQELVDISNFHYLWLRRNDSDWLEEHLPSPVKVPRKMEHLDWKKIDEELSRQVNEICENLLNSKKRPQRIYITEIIKQVGYKKWIEKRHEKLPQTTKILDRYLESLEDYMIRKLLRWAEKEFIKEKEIPSRNQLIRQAVIENTTTKNSLRIQNEINKSLARIRKEIE